MRLEREGWSAVQSGMSVPLSRYLLALAVVAVGCSGTGDGAPRDPSKCYTSYDCQAGKVCEEHACVLAGASGQSQAGCDHLPMTGCCQGEVATMCGKDGLIDVDCSVMGSRCGWMGVSETMGLYTCLQEANCPSADCSDPTGTHPKACPPIGDVCKSDCSNRECGNNGCGGSCGS